MATTPLPRAPTQTPRGVQVRRRPARSSVRRRGRAQRLDVQAAPQEGFCLLLCQRLVLVQRASGDALSLLGAPTALTSGIWQKRWFSRMSDVLLDDEDRARDEAAGAGSHGHDQLRIERRRRERPAPRRAQDTLRDVPAASTRSAVPARATRSGFQALRDVRDALLRRFSDRGPRPPPTAASSSPWRRRAARPPRGGEDDAAAAEEARAAPRWAARGVAAASPDPPRATSPATAARAGAEGFRKTPTPPARRPRPPRVRGARAESPRLDLRGLSGRTRARDGRQRICPSPRPGICPSPRGPPRRALPAALPEAALPEAEARTGDRPASANSRIPAVRPACPRRASSS